MRRTKLERELANVPRELRQLYQTVREMNTFVCEACHDEELNEHPLLGNEWTAQGAVFFGPFCAYEAP